MSTIRSTAVHRRELRAIVEVAGIADPVAAYCHGESRIMAALYAG
jgi:hypothetical protein